MASSDGALPLFSCSMVDAAKAAAAAAAAELMSSPGPVSDTFVVADQAIACVPFDLDASLEHLARQVFSSSPAYDGTISKVGDFRRKEKVFPDTRPYVTLLGDTPVPLPWAYTQTAAGLDALHEVRILFLARLAC